MNDEREETGEMADILRLLQWANLGQIEIVEAIVKSNPSLVNKHDEDGNYAVIIAARKNNFKMLKLLVSYGALLSVRAGWGTTPLGWAKRHQNTEMINYINEKLLSPGLRADAPSPTC